MASGWDDKRRDLLVYVVGRPFMFVFWSLILWGTFYLGVFIHRVMTDGLGSTWRQALSGRDALGGIANLSLAGAALVVWSLVAIVAWRAHSKRSGQKHHQRSVE